MRLLRLNRKGKLVRNSILLLVLAFLELAWLGFPAFTKAGVVRQAERRMLLTDTEVLLERREEDRHFLYTRKDEDFMVLSYSRVLGMYRLEDASVYRGEAGILCIPEPSNSWSAGERAVLALGDVTDVVSAELSLEPRQWNWERGFRLDGERVNSHCLRFPIPEGRTEVDRAELERFPNRDGEYRLRLYLRDSGGEPRELETGLAGYAVLQEQHRSAIDFFPEQGYAGDSQRETTASADRRKEYVVYTALELRLYRSTQPQPLSIPAVGDVFILHGGLRRHL